MAVDGPPAPPGHQPSPIMAPVPLVQPPVPPAQSILTQPIQPAHVPQLYWSQFKPKFTGKPDEDAEAHLLRTNDLMDTHAFQEGTKIQCL